MTPSTAGRSSPTRFIDPAVLSRIGNLEMIARFVVEGFISGLHQTQSLGTSTDFAQHRIYTPGDDVRKIDWRLFARTDRLYIKEFEAETNADVVIALDTSNSMSFKSAELSKIEYASFLIASLAHLASRQRDRVGFATFDESITQYLPPSSRQRNTIMRALNDIQASGSGNLANSMTRLSERLTRRGIVIIISDFYDDPADIAVALDSFRVRGHDVIAMHVLDAMEHDLDMQQATVVEDLESGERMSIDPSRGREAYQALVTEHIQSLEKACGDRRTDYVSFNTTQPLDQALFAYLLKRSQLVKARR